jgi:hypothetical protein
VELNPGLVKIAHSNLRKWMRRMRAKPPVRIIEGDALTVPLPDGPVALFYFNSFEREMAEMWLARLGEIAANRPWPLDLIYVHPEFDALVRQVPGMQALAEADIPFTEEDAEADVFEVASDKCAICRLSPSRSQVSESRPGAPGTRLSRSSTSRIETLKREAKIQEVITADLAQSSYNACPCMTSGILFPISGMWVWVLLSPA